jgi:hypothetical protein
VWLRRTTARLRRITARGVAGARLTATSALRVSKAAPSYFRSTPEGIGQLWRKNVRYGTVPVWGKSYTTSIGTGTLSYS